MNKALRVAYLCDSWSRSAGFLGYLREMECFYHGNGETKANPYWYGSVLSFNRLDEVVKATLVSKSIKLSRLSKFADDYATDLNGPIVKLTGLTLQHLVVEYKP